MFNSLLLQNWRLESFDCAALRLTIFIKLRRMYGAICLHVNAENWECYETSFN
ncbi:hypothetical protein PPEP_a2279 [Pseudoalteromonas peptidolytica F12-50-A1]|uniref:Uncharacterized protein n=1 Tax=Pseudoalteromonas peptidolytica F12-50-A1 TaxID=1315280 RepID=A0A8I0T5Y3_9GAMM|nr:hypothetical protein [Pseudoalteromonas peptidolytica F12-50-A1]